MTPIEYLIRAEQAGDEEPIAQVTGAAFAEVEHSDGSEVDIVSALRDSGALSVSLVAVIDDAVIGHAAASPVTIPGDVHRWFGVGPLSVMPELQQRGIGSRLMVELIDRLCEMGAAGAVLLGEPELYSRFGFEQHTGLTYPVAPAEYFMAMSFTDVPIPSGEVSYHEAFGG